MTALVRLLSPTALVAAGLVLAYRLPGSEPAALAACVLVFVGSAGPLTREGVRA